MSPGIRARASTKSRVARMATASVIVAPTGPSWRAVATKTSWTSGAPDDDPGDRPESSALPQVERREQDRERPSQAHHADGARDRAISSADRAHRRRPARAGRRRGSIGGRRDAMTGSAPPASGRSRSPGRAEGADPGTAVRRRSLAMNAATPAVTRMVTEFINSGASAGGMAAAASATIRAASGGSPGHG